ncbi:MAG TPA: type II secretion system F family protein [Actinomycetes bacterium]|nr:type II secretion system F family protein [Actinomycetes bacterium]
MAPSARPLTILRTVLLPVLGPAARRARRRLRPPGSGGVQALSAAGRSTVDEALARTARLLPGWADRRQREQEAAVPEALDVLRATIAAGVAPGRALQAAAEAAPSSLVPVLVEAVRSAELGSGAGRALADAGRQWRLTDLVLAGEALDLAEATGAPAGRVLVGVTAAARDRARGRQARLAATAEARLSARVVACMAPGFLVMLALTAPADAAFLVTSPAGWGTMAAAAAFEALGAWWASRIVAGNTTTTAPPWSRAGLPRPAERRSRPAGRSPRLVGRSPGLAGSRSASATTATRVRTAAAVDLPGPLSPSLSDPPTSSQATGSRRRLTASKGGSVPTGRAHAVAIRSPRSRRAPAARGALLAGGGVLVAALGFAAGPALPAAASLAAGCALVMRRVAHDRGAALGRAALADAAPTVIDLLGACLLAGLNPYLSLQRVAERSPEALRAELARVAIELQLGRTPSDALRAAADRTGLDELRAAAGVLGAAERWGAPPAEALAARADALRTRARLQAEAEAGRAAVRLAFPLVFCFLPAFVLLVVVPTVAGAIRALVP